jgi:hypothetical protein
MQVGIFKTTEGNELVSSKLLKGMGLNFTHSLESIIYIEGHFPRTITIM